MTLFAAATDETAVVLEALKIAHGQIDIEPTAEHITALHNSHVSTLRELLEALTVVCDDKEANPYQKLGRIRKLVAAKAQREQ